MKSHAPLGCSFQDHSPSFDCAYDEKTASHKELALNREVLMRRFIRHPSGIPINYDLLNGSAEAQLPLINIGQGGLSFFNDHEIATGTRIRISIPVEAQPFEVEGEVVWCRADGEGYSIGVAFSDHCKAFSVRMVEQVCYIEHYRNMVKSCEGREISSEQAAKEWVGKYAADFPTH